MPSNPASAATPGVRRKRADPPPAGAGHVETKSFGSDSFEAPTRREESAAPRSGLRFMRRHHAKGLAWLRRFSIYFHVYIERKAETVSHHAPRRQRRGRSSLVIAAALAVWTTQAAWAGRTTVAVAANFTAPAKEIVALFERSTGHEAILSFGSTGQLYAQITQGAPFEVLLAADQIRPEKAVASGHAVAGSRFTYARGRLVLFSRDESLVNGDATLHEGRFDRLAIANPVTAPYGAAAVEALKALGVHDRLAPRLVRGNNVAQAYQFVETGNAELGLVALSQVTGHDAGSRWIVPERLHTPISQDAVLLKAGKSNPAARTFIRFLRGPEAGAVTRRYGYSSGD